MIAYPFDPFVRAALLLVAGTAICIAQTQPAGTDSRIAKLYNLDELVTQAGASVAMEDSPSAQLTAPEQAASVVQQATTNPSPIARLVRSFVQPALLPTEEVTPVGDRWLVAICRAEQHAWIERFLKAAKDNAKHPAHQQQQVLSIECRCYSMSELVFLRDVKPSFASAGESEGVVSERAKTSYVSQVLAPGEGTTAFLQGLEDNKEVTGIKAQVVTVLPMSVGHIAVVNQTSYVRDYNLEVAHDAFIAAPIVDVIQDGIVLNAAVASLENGMLGVSLDAHVADLKRPIETQEVSLGVGQNVTVQLPSVQSSQIEAAVELAPKHFIVLAPPSLGGKRILFVVVVKPAELRDGEAPVVQEQNLRLPALQLPSPANPSAAPRVIK